MPQARSARGKLRQVERWLWQEYTPLFPVRVVFRPKVSQNSQDFATTRRIKSQFYVSIWTGLLVWPAVATRFLLHEAAHVLSWQIHREDDFTEHDHPPEWGIWMARLETDFYDGTGFDDACELSPRPWT